MILDIQKFAITKSTKFAESNLNATNNTSTLKITITFSANNSSTYFSSATLKCTCNGITQSKTVSHPVGGEATKTFTFDNIKHNSDGTKTVSWSWSCATGTTVLGTVSDSGTKVLTNLHKPPLINSWSMGEINPQLSNIGIPLGTYVRYLSQVQVNLIDATYYDGASFNKMELDVESTDGYKKFASLVGNPAILTPISTHVDRELFLKLYDNKGGSAVDESGFSYFFTVIDYSNITINGSVKREGQTSGQVSISCDGSYFNGKIGNINQGNTYSETQDVEFLDDKNYYILNNDYVLLIEGTDYNVGDSIENYFTTVYEVSNSYKPTIKYKFWEVGNTEPDWDDVSVQVITINPNNITISDGTYDVSSLYIGSTTEGEQQSGSYYFDYKKAYRLKIQVSDNFKSIETTELSITVGLPVWSEYPDHVDFRKITVNNGPLIVVDNYVKNISSIVAGGTTTLTYDIEKTGYVPIGIVGFSVGNSAINVYIMRVTSNTEAQVQVRNIYTATSTNVAVRIYVAYIKE